jgi:hypothetical protein
VSAKVYDLTVRLKGDNASYTKSIKQANTQNKGFTNSVQGMSRGLTAIQGPLNGVAGRFTALSGIVSGSAVGITATGAAFAGLTLLMGKAIATASAYEVEALKQQQILESTGYAAGLSAKSLETQANAVARNTLASVTGIKEAQNVLLTFKTVQGETFNEAIRLSQDMAAVFGGSAKDKATQLGKALEDPIQGINALKRSGVSFTVEQKEMIKTLDETGRKAEAQRFILKALQEQIGGAAGAQAGGVAGSVDSLTQSWDEFKLALVSTTDADSKTKAFLDGLTKRLDKLNKILNPDKQDQFDDLIRQRIKIIEKLKGLTNDDGEFTGFFAKDRWYNLQRDLTEVNKLLADMQEAKKVEIIEEGKAQAGGEVQKTLNETVKPVDPDAPDSFFGIKPSQIAAELAAIELSWASRIDKEYAAHQKHQDMIDAALAMEQINANKWQELSLNNWQAYETKRTEIAQKEAEKRLRKEEEERKESEEGRRQNIANLTGFNGMIVNNLREAGKEQSAIYKIAFAAQKAAAIPSMIVSTEEASTSALALAPGPAGMAMSAIIKGLGYASIGMVAGQTIAGIAHGGLGYVPEEATYLLQKGEGVLSPKQNVALSNAAERINNGSASQIIVNMYEDSSKAGSVERETGPNSEEILNVFVESIRHGGPAADEIERRYGVSRQA